MSGQLPLWDPLGPDRLLRELQGWSARAAVVDGWQRAHPDLLQVQDAHGQQDCLQLQRRSDGVHQVLFPPAASTMAPARLQPLQQLLAMAAALGFPHHGDAPLALQVLDEKPRRRDALHFDAPAGKGAPQWGVVADPYCLASRGFVLLRQAWRKQALPPWTQRADSVVWRGSTTGFSRLEPANFESLPRYQLCHRLRVLPRCDARFTAVVQVAPQADQPALVQRLLQEGLLAERMAPDAMAQSRWLLDVDGNVNSWGLLWKMLSGCCVLRVQSGRAQWFHHRVRPMQHWVPIRADLSDLEERIDWCRSHPAQCAAIADGGQRLAIQVLEELGADLLTALRWAAQPETNRPAF